MKLGSHVILALVVGTTILLAGGGLSAGASPTGQDVGTVFQDFYNRSGGVPVFGYAVSGTLQESGYTVQYFERQRMEYHPDLAGTPYSVLLGLLGQSDAESRGLVSTPPFQPLPDTTHADASCTFFTETEHRICFGFNDYWRSHGVEFGDAGTSYRESLALFGYPISEEFTDPATGMIVQYFQRARFEYHPENVGTPNVVELSLLGQSSLDQSANNQAIAVNEGLASGKKSSTTNKKSRSTPTTTATPTPVENSGTGSGQVLFGVYPGGGNGQVGYVAPPSSSQIVAVVDQLRGGRPASVHLYTAWSWYDQSALDADIHTYSSAGYAIALTIKYSPPSGHVGDVAGFASFVQSVVERYGTNANVKEYVIGNEINVVNGDPGSSDGPISGVREATIQGVISASQALARLGSRAKVGTDLAVLDRNVDAKFMQDLAQQGGSNFMSAISVMGLNVYPGLWPVGTGDPYQDMATYLTNARYTLSSAGFGQNVSIDVLENGYPTLDENLQSTKLDGFVRAICDNTTALGISGYSWFDLWDANTSSTSIYGHYGLLRSDLTKKPAFSRYQQAFAGSCAVTH